MQHKGWAGCADKQLCRENVSGLTLLFLVMSRRVEDVKQQKVSLFDDAEIIGKQKSESCQSLTQPS